MIFKYRKTNQTIYDLNKVLYVLLVQLQHYWKVKNTRRFEYLTLLVDFLGPKFPTIPRWRQIPCDSSITVEDKIPLLLILFFLQPTTNSWRRKPAIVGTKRGRAQEVESLKEEKWRLNWQARIKWESLYDKREERECEKWKKPKQTVGFFLLHENLIFFTDNY